MTNNKWLIGPSEEILHTPIWDVISTKKIINGKSSNFISLKSPDWVKAVIYNIETQKFIMVHEFRHGVNKKLYEFPSGTVEAGETAYDAALREMQEETGYGSDNVVEWEELFAANPNPAFMNNTATCFLFLVKGIPASRHLDEFEDLSVIEVDDPGEYLSKESAIFDQIAYDRACKRFLLN